MKSKYKVTSSLKSKVYNWDRNYFYVKINKATVFNVNRHYRAKWNTTIGRCFSKFCLLYEVSRLARLTLPFLVSYRHPIGKGFL